MMEKFTFIETSAKGSINVEKAFNELAFRVYERLMSGEMRANEEGIDGIKPGKGLAFQGGGFPGNMGQTGTLSSSKKLVREDQTVSANCKDNCNC